MQEGTVFRVLIVHDHHLLRRGLCNVIARWHDFQVVGEAASAAEAMEKAAQLRPDVIVLDMHLPDGSGIEVCRAIRSQNPRTRVLMLTSYSNDQAIIGSFIAGASGYLLKELRSQEVIAAVRKVGRGQSLLDPAITLRVLERVRNGTQTDEWSRLTSLEQQILELIATGKTDNEIAALVSLNVSTVKDHINSILAKLEVTRRYQATTYIAEWRMQRTSRYPQSGNSGR